MKNKIQVYLAGPIFTERDRNFNATIRDRILEKHPDIDLYLAQDNKSINDKRGCATSIAIYDGDVRRLKNSDLVITIMSADMPPIGSSYECAYYSSLCERDFNKKIIALYDDNREGSNTYSEAKRNAMLSGIAENQWPYINLLAVGFVKRVGEIYLTSEEYIEAINKQISLLKDKRKSGIYKITNLKNNLSYIGQTIDFHNRWLSHCRKEKDNNFDLYQDMDELGLEYFKFEIIEKCNPEELDEREKYWIEYYDTFNLGYNRTTGGSNNKNDIETEQTVNVYAYNLDGTLAKEYVSIASAMRDCNLKSNNITRCINFNDNHHLSGGYMWRLDKSEKIKPYEKPHFGKEIFAYDPNTREFVKAFDNASVAGKELTGKRQAHINDCALGKCLTCCGFMWSYNYFDILPKNYWEVEDER